jgi:hypothetical protein
MLGGLKLGFLAQKVGRKHWYLACGQPFFYVFAWFCGLLCQSGLYDFGDGVCPMFGQIGLFGFDHDAHDGFGTRRA